MAETYSLLGVDQKDIATLEKYLQDYFTNILKKLKDLKAQSKQTDIYLWPRHFDITTRAYIVFWWKGGKKSLKLCVSSYSFGVYSSYYVLKYVFMWMFRLFRDGVFGIIFIWIHINRVFEGEGKRDHGRTCRKGLFFLLPLAEEFITFRTQSLLEPVALSTSLLFE